MKKRYPLTSDLQWWLSGWFSNILLQLIHIELDIPWCSATQDFYHLDPEVWLKDIVGRSKLIHKEGFLKNCVALAYANAAMFNVQSGTLCAYHVKLFINPVTLVAQYQSGIAKINGEEEINNSGK